MFNPICGTALACATTIALAASASSLRAEPGVGVASEELVAGTATMQRPEVGQFGGCTGTLIARNWVLTAAHCTGHLSLFFPQGNSPLSFRIDPPVGVPQTFPVERAYSLGYPIGINDVMLLRLAAPVPETLARAATIAAAAPPAGSSVTIFGYGCNLTTPALSGRKQAFTTTLAIGSVGEFMTRNVLCSGDSGGPIFDASGRVFGVNAQSVGARPNQIDIYGDVVRRRAEIVRIMASVELAPADITMSGWCTASRKALYYGDIDADAQVDAICHDEANGSLGLARGVSGAIVARGDIGRVFCVRPGDELHVGDFNGDRRTDLLCFNRTSGRKQIDLSSGSWTAPYGDGIDQDITTAWCIHLSAQLHIGDFNDDGRSDLLCHDTRGGQKWIDYAASGGSGSRLFGNNDWDNGGNWCSHDTASLLVSDFDGDGRSDLLCHTPANGGLDVKLAHPQAVFGSPTYWQNTTVGFCRSGRLATFELTGDTRADLFCFLPAGGGNVIVSKGPPNVPFEPEIDWTNASWGVGVTRPLLVGNVAAQPWPRLR